MVILNRPIGRWRSCFWSQTRDYGFKLNKKTKVLARKSALALKAKNSAIVIVEDFDFDTPKTKGLVELTKICN